MMQSLSKILVGAAAAATGLSKKDIEDTRAMRGRPSKQQRGTTKPRKDQGPRPAETYRANGAPIKALPLLPANFRQKPPSRDRKGYPKTGTCRREAARGLRQRVQQESRMWRNKTPAEIAKDIAAGFKALGLSA